MIDLKKSEYKIPFKQLTWSDNVTDVGKKAGLIYWIGEFRVTKNGYTFMNYSVSNKMAANPAEKSDNRLIAYCNEKIGEFDTVEQAKEFCQAHFQQYILKTFFTINDTNIK